MLKNWLEPLPDWSLPNIKIRTSVLQLLLELPFDMGSNPECRRQLKESGLGRVRHCRVRRSVQRGGRVSEADRV